MLLKRLLQRKRLTVLGLNSGTSADGLDMAVLWIDSGTKKWRMLDGRVKKFPVNLKRLILAVADDKGPSLEHVIRLDNYLGQEFGRLANDYVKELADRKVKVDLVASHGQTIRHLPGKTRIGKHAVGGTLQIGSADYIAAATDLPVVADFRQADVAVGGEGAPITAGAMSRLFADSKKSRLIVNIGGMANYFYLPRYRSPGSVKALDCGPGNSVCDTLVAELFGKSFDRNGLIAAKGNVSQRLLSVLVSHPFFKAGSVSTGREAFGPDTVRQILDFGKRFSVSPEDLIATAAELTTTAIAVRVFPLVEKDIQLTAMYLTGGGRHNAHYRKRLAHHLPDLDIRSIDELGVDGDLVEAAAFAVMGEACLRSEALTRPTTRQRKNSIMLVAGHIVQPPESIKK